MFAVKSMEVNSNLMKLKLDMVYRGLQEESARTRFTEITAPYPAEGPRLKKERAAASKKTVKALPPKKK
jgi:hypothetical protein